MEAVAIGAAAVDDFSTYFAVADAGNFKTVVFEKLGPPTGFLEIDNLSYTTIPEPSVVLGALAILFGNSLFRVKR